VKPAVIIQNGKAKSEMLAEAVIQGWGGGVILREPTAIPNDHMPVVIGAWPTTARWLHEFHRGARDFLYVDNGYFRPYREGGYFRITRNALQVKAEGNLTDRALQRWNALGIETQPWRSPDQDGYVLLVLQTSAWFQMMGLCREDWVRRTLTELERHTDRVIRIREKPLKGSGPTTSIHDDLRDAWAVVGLSSNCMVQAVVAGVPVFPTGHCAASPFGSTLNFIEHPLRPNRKVGLAILADNQWTVEEIAAGAARQHLAKPAPFEALA